MKRILFWFRRDLRLTDNRALSDALSTGAAVIPVFVLDPHFISQLPPHDKRISYIYQALTALNQQLHKAGSTLLLIYGDSTTEIPRLAKEHNASAVYANADYEPGYPKERDTAVAAALHSHGISWHTACDHLIFPPGSILTKARTPFTIFTPFSRAWLAALTPQQFAPAAATGTFARLTKSSLPELSSFGFHLVPTAPLPSPLPNDLLTHYATTRDIPSLAGTSRYGVHLRFGTVSLRALLSQALAANATTFVQELIWREFFIHALYHFPHIATSPFRPQYATFPYEENPAHLLAWQEGRTGFPFIDAGMRELAATGFMHNRARMAAASFLTKLLRIHWRLGEAHFARHLLDYEAASNIGNWQWAAGSGMDAAPYFRIFNPSLQLSRFDPQHLYIRTHLPDYGTSAYPAPIIDYPAARRASLASYASSLSRPSISS